MPTLPMDVHVRFLEEAVCLHARQVRRYIHAEVERLAEEDPEASGAAWPLFRATAGQLLDQLDRLLAVAGRMPAMNRLNREQLEAEADRLRREVRQADLRRVAAD